MTRFFLITFLFVISTSCIKTAEQVQREKRFESMSDQVGDTQGLVADLLAQMKSMQSQLDKMNGRLEEMEHRQGKMNPEDVAKMNENLNFLKTQQEGDATQLLQIQNELKGQRAFIEKVTASLGSVSENRASVTKSSKKKGAKTELTESLNLIKNNKFNEARTELEGLIDHKDLSPGEKNRVLHGLGRTEFYSGNHEKAMIYFSKVFTKFPKASLAPSSLLFIGKSLEKMGKKDEAKQAFQKVVEDYSGTKEANEARKEL